MRTLSPELRMRGGLIPMFRSLAVSALVLGVFLGSALARDPLFVSNHPSTLSLMALDTNLMLNFVCTKRTGFKYYLSISRDLVSNPVNGDVVMFFYRSKDKKKTSVDGLRIYQIEKDFVNADPHLPQPQDSKIADVRLSWLMFEKGFDVAYLGSFAAPKTEQEYRKRVNKLLQSLEGKPLHSSEFKMESEVSKARYNSFLEYCHQTVESPSDKPVLARPKE